MPRAKKAPAPEPEPQPVQDEINPNIECGICGREGGPYADCGICRGHAPIQSKAFTLSDVRSGRAPEDERYGEGGSVGPKIVNLPGSARSHG